MRFILAIVITAVINYVLGIILPWWIIAVGGLVVAVALPQHPFKAFLAGFLGCFILWFLIALIINSANHQVLSRRIAALFSFSEPFLMVVLTGFIGGLVTGMAAASGSLLIRLRARKRGAA